MSKSNILIALELNFTKKRDDVINGGQVGPETFESWKNAMLVCHEHLYKYERAKRIAAGMGKDGKIDATLVTNAFNALQAVIDLVGEVNGFPIVKNQAMLDTLAPEAMKKSVALIGKALTLKSQLDNADKQLDALNFNGVNPEAVEHAQAEYDRIKAEFDAECKKPGSCEKSKDKCKDATFRKNFEREFYEAVIAKQEAKTWEQLKAEDDARKAERRAKTKAKREALKAAKAAAAAAEAQATNA